MADLKEKEELPVPATSKDESDVPETPLSVIESLKLEAAVMSQVKLRQMKRLEFRRGSVPAVQLAPVVKAGKSISNDRVHQIMQTFYGPQTKKRQLQMKQVGVLDPAEKLSDIQINPEQRIHAGNPPRHLSTPPTQASIPVAPPLPGIMPSALTGEQKTTPEVKPIPVVVQPEKPKLTEVVASLNPTITLPPADNKVEFAAATPVRRSSVTQDLEDTYKKMERKNSLGLSDSGSSTQSGEGGSSWFGGLIGFRPAPAPRKPGESKPAAVKKKVKKRDLNAFAPAGF
jgi:hypothetical protein